MPVTTTKASASSQGYGEFTASAPKLYIEDVFSTYLYAGNGSTQTITNGIDLSGKGGLVWFKSRSGAYNHALIDTARGGGQVLSSNATSAQADYSPQGISAFNTNGFTFGTTTAELNNSSNTYVSWTFRKQPKFFDVVTYTGASPSSVTVNHNLGSVPGCIIIKCINDAASWAVYHRSTGIGQILYLNGTQAASSDTTFVTAVTSTSFTVGDNAFTNNSPSKTYVAYLFAHDAGGFGLSGTDNVISCGSFTTGSGGKMSAAVDLGYEAQWLLAKNTSSAESWVLYDVMRGMNNSGYAAVNPNSSGAEYTGTSAISATATGFDTPNASGPFANSSTYIYIAIRRGPMKVPPSGTSVYNAEAFTGTGATKAITTLSAPDMAWIRAYKDFTNSNTIQVYDRLRGNGVRLRTGLTNADNTNAVFLQFNNQMLATVGNDSETNGSGALNVAWAFKRAPGFFDVVCYAGTGSNLTVAHNLTVAPQLIIIKNRTNSWSWNVGYNFGVSSYDFLTLDNNDPGTGNSYNSHYTAAPTATQFFLATNVRVNQSSANFVAYLFATVAGVSKVGSYTGTGTTKQIDCGFTGGARFVLIKRTDSTGDWYVYDTARGIVAGNDPYLFLNSTAAEVTTTDYVDTYSAGFELSSTAPAGLNANGGTYIFLAIA